jgi:hypothetical protein
LQCAAAGKTLCLSNAVAGTRAGLHFYSGHHLKSQQAAIAVRMHHESVPFSPERFWTCRPLRSQRALGLSVNIPDADKWQSPGNERCSDTTP